MALFGQAIDCPIRKSNKEPEWSSICNNVFDQYLDTDDLFGGFDAEGRGRSSSNDSGNLFEFSTGSEQSHQTGATSPIPFWEDELVVAKRVVRTPVVEAKQPKAQEPVDFWTKKLKALERNAAESERRQQTLRAAKSHPDFLSLGGCPSPPALPASPTDQSLSVKRQRSRFAANGKRHASQARSLSRGRPTGVTKSTAAGIGAGSTVNPYATVRKAPPSASPGKMMNPSRYRAGFKDVWAEKAANSPHKFSLNVACQAPPDSPPPSANQHGDGGFISTFGSPPPFIPMPPSNVNGQLSPLTRTLQQAHLHTPPTATPAIHANAAAHASNSYFEQEPSLQTSNVFATQTVPLNDTAPLYPERTSSFASNNVQAFDFGFSSSPDLDSWNAEPFADSANSNYNINLLSSQDPFADLHSVLPSTEPHEVSLAGLGISCDPSLVSGTFSPFDLNSPAPMTIYDPRPPAVGPYCIPGPGYATMPATPRHCRPEARRCSDSPEPAMTDVRSRRSVSRTRRSASRHRRTKSTNSTPRHPQNADKGGFVNFTPSDSNKILSGVAPSGSSKTKARREKEAADKRRRLSQAAMRAVAEAGGNVEALAKAGLLA